MKVIFLILDVRRRNRRMPCCLNEKGCIHAD
jgi:hypothetical protein